MQFHGKIGLIRRIPSLLSEKERVKHTVEDVRAGGFIQVGDEYYLVDTRHRYEETYKGKKWIWYELELICISDSKQFFLEYERDDELELSFWEKKLSLSDIGLTKSMLENFDEEEKGRFSYQNTVYEYEDSGEVTFFRNDGGDGDEYYFWDFEEVGPDGDKLIAVERWSKNEYEVSVGHGLEAEEVSVLALGGESHGK